MYHKEVQERKDWGQKNNEMCQRIWLLLTWTRSFSKLVLMGTKLKQDKRMGNEKENKCK